MQEGSELTEASLGPPSGLRQAEYPGELALLGPPLAQVDIGVGLNRILSIIR